jgi:hypothetical protein
MSTVKELDRMLEADIKALTLNYLRDKGIINQDSIIMNELTIGNYLRRVDLAIFTNCKLIAFEIKSEADSLYRLDGQVDTYLKYFDKVIVISDSKFIPKMVTNLPKSVGLWEINKATIKVKNKGRYKNKIDSRQLIDYMDVVDLVRLTSTLKIRSEKNRSSLESAIANVSNKNLRQEVQVSLNRKFAESNRLFIKETGNKVITTNDLKLLSRFSSQREKNKLEEKQKKEFWSNIDEHIADLTRFVNSATEIA